MKNEKNFTNEESLKVIYVIKIGENADYDNIYHFLISEETDDTWAEGWENKPASLMRHLTPEDDMYDYVGQVITEVNLDLAQDNSCYSMQDCRDKIIALASENIDDADEYPEKGRIVIHFGDSVSKIKKLLSKRDITMEYV